MTDFTYNDRVDFSETDAGGIVFFTNFLRWVARAEGAWFASLGVMGFERLPDGTYRGYPRVGVKCDYRAPLFPGDTFAVVLTPVRAGRTSFTYAFRVHRTDANGILAAEGSMSIVFAKGTPGGVFDLAPIPETLVNLARRDKSDSGR